MDTKDNEKPSDIRRRLSSGNKKFTLSTRLQNLITTCKAKGTEYRVLVRGLDTEDKVKVTRLSIIVDNDGNVLTTYYG